MGKSFFIDTSMCTACRGCQVACKQWHGLAAEETLNRGTYQNPEDLSCNTYKLVRMREEIIDAKPKWLFFPDQCRHCLVPPCQDMARAASAVFTDAATGAVIFTANTKALNADEIIKICPYNIPRKFSDGTLAKCDMCIDRVRNGLMPACVKTCPSGAMNFGERKEMMALAARRLKQLKKKSPRARLLDAEHVRVIYLVEYDPGLYHDFALASWRSTEMTRFMALPPDVGPVFSDRSA